MRSKRNDRESTALVPAQRGDVARGAVVKVPPHPGREGRPRAVTPSGQRAVSVDGIPPLIGQGARGEHPREAR